MAKKPPHMSRWYDFIFGTILFIAITTTMVLAVGTALVFADSIWGQG